MPLRLDEARIRAFLLDIEGTTTPVEFVYQVLFPYARQHVREFLARHAGEELVRADLEGLRAEHAADLAKGPGPPAWPGEASASGAVQPGT